MYSYELINNHYVVDIDNKKYLLDTGSPLSFYINNKYKDVVIDDVRYPLHQTPPNLDIYKTTKLVGVKLDGFIGLDIIRQTSLTIYKNNNIDFTTHQVVGTILPLRTFPLLSIKTGSNLMSGDYVIDTGAKYAYGVKGLFYKLSPFSRVSDYSPIYGDLVSDIYHLNVLFGDKYKPVDTCDNDIVSTSIKNINALIIGNITTLFDEVCVFDIKKGLLIVK